MYDASCIRACKEYGSDVDIFCSFLHECRLAWPQQPEQGGAVPLDVLITLAMNWQVALFCEVRAMRLSLAPNWRIILRPGSFVPLMYQHHVMVKDSGGYARSSVSLFARAERAAVSSRFYLLVSAAIDMVNSSEWLDAEVLAARVLTAENSLSTQLHLWPPKKCLEHDVFRHMYDAFPSTESSFTKYWVSSPLAVRLRHTARAPTSSF
ncbi:hypothetical protein HPB51_009558 [Rhipicephalus microplus]|nr:hypothetical protein HPB51_009558 [Rhipicephalus microplus]